MSNIEENKKLVEEFPFLIPSKITNKDYNYKWTFLDDLPNGWRVAFGKQICEELKEELIRTGELENYEILEIKEKYGCLCWYDNMYTPELYEIIKKYEQISKDTCVKCGRVAEYDSIGGWISPYCGKCARDTVEEYNKIHMRIYEAKESGESYKPVTINHMFVDHETFEDFNY